MNYIQSFHHRQAAVQHNLDILGEYIHDDEMHRDINHKSPYYKNRQDSEYVRIGGGYGYEPPQSARKSRTPNKSKSSTLGVNEILGDTGFIGETYSPRQITKLMYFKGDQNKTTGLLEIRKDSRRDRELVNAKKLVEQKNMKEAPLEPNMTVIKEQKRRQKLANSPKKPVALKKSHELRGIEKEKMRQADRDYRLQASKNKVKDTNHFSERIKSDKKRLSDKKTAKIEVETPDAELTDFGLELMEAEMLEKDVFSQKSFGEISEPNFAFRSEADIPDVNDELLVLNDESSSS